MSGPVNLVVRRESGEVMATEVNAGTPDYFILYSNEFNSGNYDAAIDAFVRDYFNGETPSDIGLCMVGYGIVVIDIQNKKLWSMQGYDHPGNSMLNLIGQLKGSTSPEILKWKTDTISSDTFFIRRDNGQECGVIDYFGTVDAILVSELAMYCHALIPEKLLKALSASGMAEDTIKNLPAYMDAVDGTPPNMIPRRLSGFEVHYLDKSELSKRQLLQQLREDGFVISVDDEASWFSD